MTLWGWKWGRAEAGLGQTYAPATLETLELLGDWPHWGTVLLCPSSFHHLPGMAGLSSWKEEPTGCLCRGSPKEVLSPRESRWSFRLIFSPGQRWSCLHFPNAISGSGVKGYSPFLAAQDNGLGSQHSEAWAGKGQWSYPQLCWPAQGWEWGKGPASCQGNKSKQTLPPLTGLLACWGACGNDLICPPNPTPKARLKVGGPGLFVLGPDPWKRLGLGVQGCSCCSLSVGGRNKEERRKMRGQREERSGEGRKEEKQMRRAEVRVGMWRLIELVRGTEGLSKTCPGV